LGNNYKGRERVNNGEGGTGAANSASQGSIQGGEGRAGIVIVEEFY